MALGIAASTAFDMKPRPADFGQTLGVYGLGDGIYFCWPVLGPIEYQGLGRLCGRSLYKSDELYGSGDV